MFIFTTISILDIILEKNNLMEDFLSEIKIVPKRPIEHKGDNAQCHFTTQEKTTL